MSCSDLQTAWHSFASTHRQCNTDSDCATFLAMNPGDDTCDNPPGLNQVINQRFMTEAESYAERYFQLACGGSGDPFSLPSPGSWNDFGWDGGPLTNPRCISGSCTADTPYCNTPPPLDDGGPRLPGATDGGSVLVACNDGTGNTDCCPASAVQDGPCNGTISQCSRGGCHGGFTSYLYCGGGLWSAGAGLHPCSVDAAPDSSP